MSDPDLTPERDASVRALLASAKHTEATPPEVVARLDDVLAGLVSERRAQHAPVLTLAARRRRVVSSALLAAAAVVVFGVGITEVLPSVDESGDSSAGSDAGSMEDQTATQSDRRFGAESDGGSQDAELEAEESQRSTDQNSPLPGARGDLGALSSTTDLRPQVRALRPGRAPSPYLASPSCPVPGAATATQVAITFDGLPAALVYREPAARSQRVDVFLCGEADPLRSVRLRVR